MLVVTLLAVLVWLAHKVHRYDPPLARGLIDSDQRIAGWLLLLALGIVIQPLKILKGVIEQMPAYAADSWMRLTTVGQTNYDALWAPVLLFELVANLSMLVFSVVLLILFFQRRSSVPRVYLAFQGGALIVAVLDMMAANLIPVAKHEEVSSALKPVIQQAFVLVLWGSYLMTSKRVKATFVKTWRAPE